MAELKDVVEELIHKTRGGWLNWTTSYEGGNWRTIVGGCVFIVYQSDPRLYLSWTLDSVSESQTYSDDDVIRPLVEVLDRNFPLRETTPDMALQIALDCLREGG